MDIFIAIEQQISLVNFTVNVGSYKDFSATLLAKRKRIVIMIVGSGLLASAFRPDFGVATDLCVYAAGVSNSNSTDAREFLRESERLSSALDRFAGCDLFLYFGTCSVFGATSKSSAYVLHKLKMEGMVSKHPRYLIVRLPQLVGRTNNSNTLVNYLYSKIYNEEPFQVWSKSKRNIIDVEDVVHMVRVLALEHKSRCEIVNVANTTDIDVPVLVELLAKILEKKPRVSFIDKQDNHFIDTKRSKDLAVAAGITFDATYAERLLRKYYESNFKSKNELPNQVQYTP